MKYKLYIVMSDDVHRQFKTGTSSFLMLYNADLNTGQRHFSNGKIDSYRGGIIFERYELFD